MLRQLLHRWAGRLPGRIIPAEVSDLDRTQAPLFERYYVGTTLGWTIYLHHYLRPDPDRGLHDHPWPRAIVLPLCAGYIEARLSGFDRHGRKITVHRRRPFVPYSLRGSDFHRIALFPPGVKTTWSVFVHRPNSKGWGFLRDTLIDSSHETPTAFVSFVPVKYSGSDDKWWRTARIGACLKRAEP